MKFDVNDIAMLSSKIADEGIDAMTALAGPATALTGVLFPQICVVVTAAQDGSVKGVSFSASAALARDVVKAVLLQVVKGLDQETEAGEPEGGVN